MADILQFPTEAAARLGFERVKSTYTAGEISQQFGLPRRTIRRWTDEGLIPTAPGSAEAGGEALYDFQGLNRFRRVRELRARGLTLKQIDRELRGQLNLFSEPRGQLLQMPVRLSPFEEALRLHERRDPGAAQAYRDAIQADDYVADACCNLGILEYEAERVPGAFDCFTTALKHDPRHFESHFNLAYLYFETEDLRLARLHYELAAEIEPSFPNLYFNLGLVHAMRGDLERAETALTRVRELAPDDEALDVGDLLTKIQSALTATRNRRSRR
jgi:DNA-binding transcriptional MerR regulator